MLGGIAETDRANQTREISGSASWTVGLAAFVDGGHQEDGGRRQRRQHRLRSGGGTGQTLIRTGGRGGSKDGEHVASHRERLV